MLPRELLFQVSAPFTAVLGELDLRALQLAYADLMDEAAEGVQTRRLDLDDVLLERSATVLHPATGRSWTIPIDGISDSRPLHQAFEQATRADGEAGLSAAEAQIRALHVAVYRETGLPLIDLRKPPSGGLE
jgi:hypothetical protein